MVRKLHTHYDNLKVTRNAPLEVIRAAYKALAQKHHPDRNSAEESQRVMQSVNESWNVLSDTALRAEHDRWIAEQEAMARHEPPAAPQAPERVRRRTRKKFSARVAALFGPVLVLLVITLVSVAGFSALEHPPQSRLPARNIAVASAQAAPSTQPQATHAQRALLDYGQELPSDSGPIIGARPHRVVGHSTVTIDNEQGQGPVVVKLCYAAWTHCSPVQHIYMTPRTSFTMKNIPPGTYDVRYVDLDSGLIYRSRAFALVEGEASAGARPSAVNMKLHQPVDGKPASTQISLNQF